MGISIETSPISWIPGDKDEPIARDVSHLSARWTNTYLKTYIKTYIKIYIKVRGRLSPQASWIRPRTCGGASGTSPEREGMWIMWID